MSDSVDVATVLDKWQSVQSSRLRTRSIVEHRGSVSCRENTLFVLSTHRGVTGPMLRIPSLTDPDECIAPRRISPAGGRRWRVDIVDW